MAGKLEEPEEIVSKIRRAEVLQGQGATIAEAVRQIAITCGSACKIGSEADLVQSNLPSAIYRQVLEEIADGVTVFTAGFPASRSQGRSGRACWEHGPDPLAFRQSRGSVPALRHGFTSCSQQIPPTACRSACAWPEGGTGPVGSPISLLCSAVPGQDICGAVPTCGNPAACAAYLPSARTGPAPRPGTRRAPGTGARRTAPAAGQQGYVPPQHPGRGDGLKQ